LKTPRSRCHTFPWPAQPGIIGKNTQYGALVCWPRPRRSRRAALWPARWPWKRSGFQRIGCPRRNRPSHRQHFRRSRHLGRRHLHGTPRQHSQWQRPVPQHPRPQHPRQRHPLQLHPARRLSQQHRGPRRNFVRRNSPRRGLRRGSSLPPIRCTNCRGAIFPVGSRFFGRGSTKATCRSALFQVRRTPLNGVQGTRMEHRIPQVKWERNPAITRPKC
jgi:hypothetical protein